MKANKTNISSFVILGYLMLCSCAPFIYSPSARPKPIAIEAVSSHDEALLQIQSAPTRFFIDVENNAAAWERARFFLTQYTGPGRVDIQSTADREQLTKVSESGFRYHISRTFESGGAQYHVICTPTQAGADTTTALLNAKNLARFIREGELELSQIK